MDEPACGFFITGSSIKPANGVYIRRNPSQSTLEAYMASDRRPLLYYKHMEQGSEWTLALIESIDHEEDNDEDEHSYTYSRYSRPPPERWWNLSQERDGGVVDRFRHVGDTIVPGAGAPRWTHVHAASASEASARAAAARATRSWFGFGASTPAPLTLASDDDEDELPWQVIAVLDREILSQLIGGAEYHKYNCAEAMSGRGVVKPPAVTSLEGLVPPAGMAGWLYRVTSPSGITVLSHPSLAAAPTGHRRCGEFVRAVEISRCGGWLRLEAASRRLGAFSSHVGGSQEEWVARTAKVDDATGDPDVPVLQRIEVTDVHSTSVEGEAEEVAALSDEAGVRRAGLAGVFLDLPFVPQIEDESGEVPSAARTDKDTDEESEAFHEAIEIEDASSDDEDANEDDTSGLPQLSWLEEADRGSAEAATIAARAGEKCGEPSPTARLMAGAMGAGIAAAAARAVSSTKVSETQLGIGELSQALRDETQAEAVAQAMVGGGMLGGAGLDRAVASLGGALQVEGSHLLRLRLALVLVLLRDGSPQSIQQALAQSAEAEARHPSAAAAALVRAQSLLRVGRRAEGLASLSRACEQGFKALRRRRRAAARAARGAAENTLENSAPSPSAELSTAAEDAPIDVTLSGATSHGTEKPVSVGSIDVGDEIWAVAASMPMTRALRAIEKRQVLARDRYDRGLFTEAAEAYAAAAACAEAGTPHDIHARAALLTNAAACLRRARKPGDAVAKCDAALALLPKFGRALFRRATCLLEDSKPTQAVAAFEDLYRVNRDWPNLSDWLLRAHAATRRAETASTSATSESTNGSRSAAAHGDQAVLGDDTPAAEGLAREPDHYVVLGVTVDATDKQLQQAYRMRSLKFHPDRKGGSTRAFQRIAAAFQTLSDPIKRADYDRGGDVRTRSHCADGEDSEDEEEHKKTLREEIERKYYPERYEFWPFGDPFIHKRKRQEQKRRQQGRPAWYEEDDFGL